MLGDLIEFESETIQYEDTAVTLHKIKSDAMSFVDSPMHTHSYFELLLAVDGPYTCHTTGGELEIAKGELLIIEPHFSHRAYEAEQTTHIAALGLEVNGKGRFYEFFVSFLQAQAGKPIKLQQSVFHDFLRYYAAPARHTVRQICERKREACELLSALWELAEQEGNERDAFPSTASDIVLETLVHSGMPLSEIAAQLGYSERQIQRKILARYGKSLRKIRGELR